MGLGRLDRQGRPRLHPRQRRRADASTRRPGGERSRRRRRTRTERRSSATTSKATSAATAPPAPASSARSRRRPRSTASASSARASPAAATSCSFGLRYAVEQGFDVVNLSLSTTKKDYAAVLHELADSAYFQRTVLVASAHNMPVESYPWRFSSVISVGSHEDADPLSLYYNPNPPVEFFAQGRRRRGRLARAARRSALREQLRDAARLGHLRADPLEAPRADAVPAEERPAPDLVERGRNDDERRLNAAVAAARPGLGGALPRAAPLRRRGGPRDLRGQGVLDPAARRGGERARLRGGRRRGRGRPARAALPGGHRRRGLGARDADAARDRGRRPRPALREGRRRGTRATCRRG